MYHLYIFFGEILSFVLSRVQLFATSWTHQAPLSMDFPVKNTGVGCHFLLEGIFPTQGIKPASLVSPELAGGFFTTSAT